MNNWVPLALEPKTYTWVCGRDDGALLTAVPEEVEIKRRRNANARKSTENWAKEVLRVTEVSAGVETINSTYIGTLPLKVMQVGRYALKAAYSEKLRTWFVAKWSVEYYPDPRPLEEIALEINENLRKLNEHGLGEI